MIEKDILYKVTRDARDSACSGQSQVEGASCTAPAAGLRPETPPEGSREGPPVLSLKVGILPGLSFLQEAGGSGHELILHRPT